jgi:hypothetical protein|tara:strand:- start:198 stop:407 length:210 start_codon:yes stop_codon:yes gene_type:complete
MKANIIISALLLLGIVDQIENNSALIEYKKDGKIMHSYVSLDLSPCMPEEGQHVYFYEDYKIVTCVEDE